MNNDNGVRKHPRAVALLIDDDPDICILFESRLRLSGFSVHCVHTVDDALQYLKSRRFDLILLDLVLGETNALPAIPEILQAATGTRLWVLTAHSSIEAAVQAMRSGAAGFFSKTQPVDAIIKELEAAFSSLQTSSSSHFFVDPAVSGLYGTSHVMQLVRQNVARMKDVDSTVLVCGESGTGKELIARALHHSSPRQNYPFAALNCGAIPENLLESELFGHRRGSFTDAKADRKGYFEHCSSGTLLLDEVGELPLSLQVKLLRVLQEKEIYPIGATQPVKVNTRVIAATNRRLEDEVRTGRFREDLYYRLSVLRIESPALRHRKEDIPVLAGIFINRFSKQIGRTLYPPSQELLARMLAYEWPGNVRELQNAIERAAVLSEDGHLHLDDLFPPDVFSLDTQEGQETALLEELGTPALFETEKIEFERNYLTRLLKAAKGNVSEAARLSGQHRPQLYRLMQKYSIHPGQYSKELS